MNFRRTLLKPAQSPSSVLVESLLLSSLPSGLFASGASSRSSNVSGSSLHWVLMVLALHAFLLYCPLDLIQPSQYFPGSSHPVLCCHRTLSFLQTTVCNESFIYVINIGFLDILRSHPVSFTSPLYPQRSVECLAHCEWSINICGENERTCIKLGGTSRYKSELVAS